MIEIQGMTDLQRSIADRLWRMDTQGQVDQYIHGLPQRLRREAWVVQQMIIWAELDTYEEIADDVQDLIHSIRSR